jgi:hypothetical protein
VPVESFCLQDWVTITSGNGDIPSLAQGAARWLDIGDYEDLVFFTEVKSAVGSVVLTYETAPSREDSAFLPLLTTPYLLYSTGPGLYTASALSCYLAIPPARYVRWRVSVAGEGSAGLTFRAWVSAYASPAPLSI